MPNNHPTEADRAARAFYDQPADLFAKQIAQICANDSRLVAIFERTRETYLAKMNAENC